MARDLFRANELELYKSLPSNMNKILVVDNWYHRDYLPPDNESISDNQLLWGFNQNEDPKKHHTSVDAFLASCRLQIQETNEFLAKEAETTKPSSYETWRLFADVLSSGDAGAYLPNLKPNSDWSNWKQSGQL